MTATSSALTADAAEAPGASEKSVLLAAGGGAPPPRVNLVFLQNGQKLHHVFLEQNGPNSSECHEIRAVAP